MADRTVYNGISIRELKGRTGTDMKGSGDNAERKFLCRGSEDPLFCRQALYDQNFYNLFEYDDLPLKTLERSKLGFKAWQFTAGYAYVPPPETYTVTIDTGGGTVKQLEAFQQVQYDATGQTGRAYGTAINVDKDKKVQGADIVIPALQLTVNATIPAISIGSPIGYAQTIARLTGSVNNSTYLGFAAGELLFMGGSGTIVSRGDPTMQFTFGASGNLNNYTIGPVQGITKAGWDFIWFDYELTTETEALIPKPLAAYVSRVYPWASFGGLLIPGS